MKKGIFTRIFILYGLILLLAVFGAELSLTGIVRESKIALLRDNLSVQAALIGREVPFRTAQNLDPFCREVKATTGSRVTVIAPKGTVLGDSDHDSAAMENHIDRLEVQQAMLAGTGMAIRHSETLNANLLYVAKKIGKDASPSGYVRLSVPLTSVESMVNALRIKIFLIVSAILLATGGFSFWQIDRLRRLTLQIRDFAGSVAGGVLGKRLFLGRDGEFDEIAESLNTMSSELQQVLAASEEEKRRLNVILRNIPEALLITDTKGTIQLSNAASRIYFGEAALPGNLLIESIRNREFLALLDTV
ncbi:MAG TPA: HAMP domain-containing protein, partial [Nitrospirota bacterium]|nr:HAMP domain-containing protein [Nitrospirota bacterium]